MTAQVLMFAFGGLESNQSILQCFLEVWAAFAGTLILFIMFVKKHRKSGEFIFSVIGLLLWCVQIFNVYSAGVSDLLQLILTCIVGILGMILVGISLLLEASAISESRK